MTWVACFQPHAFSRFLQVMTSTNVQLNNANLQHLPALGHWGAVATVQHETKASTSSAAWKAEHQFCIRSNSFAHLGIREFEKLARPKCPCLLPFCYKLAPVSCKPLYPCAPQSAGTNPKLGGQPKARNEITARLEMALRTRAPESSGGPVIGLWAGMYRAYGASLKG